MLPPMAVRLKAALRGTAWHKLMYCRSTTRLYQSGLKLLWNLRSGAYTTLDVDELREIDQADFIRSVNARSKILILFRFGLICRLHTNYNSMRR